MTSPCITILAFARAREVFGFTEKTIPLAPDQTADEFLKNLLPDWRAQLADSRIAIDLEFVNLAAPLRAGQTLAIIPPVSGG